MEKRATEIGGGEVWRGWWWVEGGRGGEGTRREGRTEVLSLRQQWSG